MRRAERSREACNHALCKRRRQHELRAWVREMENEEKKEMAKEKER